MALTGNAGSFSRFLLRSSSGRRKRGLLGFPAKTRSETSSRFGGGGGGSGKTKEAFLFVVAIKLLISLDEWNCRRTRPRCV
ncbi:hypothetical protein OPV22_024880 [Ensete ventricosum]|uniref:Uncharacterized protein n=1 Tax=Ensete ventricosum TaxID=4639 RepID=A0AAV8QG39_ENSVE|nr:hypothetical protein OPV22_024880 [Ensete ventricosum]